MAIARSKYVKRLSCAQQKIYQILLYFFQGLINTGF